MIKRMGPGISGGGLITLQCHPGRCSLITIIEVHITFTVYPAYATVVTDSLQGANIPRYYQNTVFWNSATYIKT